MAVPPLKVHCHRNFRPSTYILRFLPLSGHRPPLEYKWKGSRQDRFLYQIVRRRRSVLVNETDALPREEFETTMFRSWKIGTAFGIGVHIHPTFWILPLILAVNGLSIALGYVGLALVVLAGAMACVVLHEFGHALMARYFGIRTRVITLYPTGGVARLERLSDKPLEEVLIALAGPAVNVVIAVLLFPFVVLTNPSLGLPDWDANPGGFVLVL